jgi:hypothetical protein
MFCQPTLGSVTGVAWSVVDHRNHATFVWDVILESLEELDEVEPVARGDTRARVILQAADQVCESGSGLTVSLSGLKRSDDHAVRWMVIQAPDLSVNAGGGLCIAYRRRHVLTRSGKSGSKR